MSTVDRFFVGLMIGLLIALFAGCAFGGKMKQLSPAMSQEQVTETLGRPDGVETYSEGWAVWRYNNRMSSDWSWDRGDYFVIFDPAGVVTSYGQGMIREKNVGGVYTVVLVQ